MTVLSANPQPRTNTAAQLCLAGELVHSPAVDASLRYCETVVRSRARNFWFGLRLTPQPKRSALFALYAWMREADDLVDEPTARPDAFALFTRRTREVLASPAQALRAAPPANAEPSCWPAFAWLLQHTPLRHGWLNDLLLGLASDQQRDQLALAPDAPLVPAFHTSAELDVYRYRVAGTVGCCCTSIWGLQPGVNHTDALHLADLRGRAFQMVNIVRDIGSDAAQGRCFIPADHFSSLTLADLLAWRDPRACAALIARLVAVARAEFAASVPLAHALTPDCAPVLCALTEIYQSLLDQLARDPRRCVQRVPASLPTWRKAAIAARWSIASALIGTRADRFTPRVDAHP